MSNQQAMRGLEWEVRTDDSSLQSDPPVFTWAVLVACVAAMVLELRENAAGVDFDTAATESCHFRLDLQWHFCAAALSANPFFGPTTAVLVKWGAIDSARIVEKGEAWRLVAAMFLHGGIVHLCINMITLLGVGLQLERNHGSVRVAAIYMLSGVFGALASAMFAPDSLSVGASGAIFGLIGACIGDLLLNWDLYRRPCVSMFLLLLFSSFQLLLGTMPLLDNFAHTFGFSMGLVSSLALLRRLLPSKKIAATCSRRFVRLVAACCALAALLAAFGVLYGLDDTDANEICPQCSKISCVPFPWGCEADQSSSCWWTCDAAQTTAACTVTFTGQFTGQSTGTIQIDCNNNAARIFVRGVELEGWDDTFRASLCREHCG